MLKACHSEGAKQPKNLLDPSLSLRMTKGKAALLDCCARVHMGAVTRRLNRLESSRLR